MYRDTDWQMVLTCVGHDMDWGWMAVSLFFGVLPQVFRALRWRMALLPLGESARCRVCVDAIFLSYASSLVVPRIGEVTRCATLKRYDGISFARSFGTVVSERMVDSLLLLLLSVGAFAWQLPVFLHFLHTTGAGVSEIAGRFTGTGYIVTGICLFSLLAMVLGLLGRARMTGAVGGVFRKLWEGFTSLRRISGLPLYLCYSAGIWAGYFLHFYFALFCFEATSHINISEALLIFCVGSFAVLVPTPNGAGPWHFAVKTMLVLYGVAETPAVLVALVVHTVQTALVVLLGACGWGDLLLIGRPLPTDKA